MLLYFSKIHGQNVVEISAKVFQLNRSQCDAFKFYKHLHDFSSMTCCMMKPLLYIFNFCICNWVRIGHFTYQSDLRCTAMDQLHVMQLWPFGWARNNLTLLKTETSAYLFTSCLGLLWPKKVLCLCRTGNFNYHSLIRHSTFHWLCAVGKKKVHQLLHRYYVYDRIL